LRTFSIIKDTMKLKLPLIAAFAAILSLTACGGGSSPAATVAVESPATLVTTEVFVPATGTVAAAPMTVTVKYTGWLYTTTKADFKGTQFDSSTFTFQLGANKVIPGFELGVLGMKVGGKRTVLIPAAQAYGSASSSAIPANSGLVFDIELTAAN
jgi:FKBP-type peptidyl-prolyl cis-trans isomerase FkpA